MSKAMQSTRDWPAGRAIRWTGAIVVVVAAMLSPSVAKADPPPPCVPDAEGQGCGRTVIILQQIPFPDGRKPEDKFGILNDVQLGPDGQWHAGDIAPSPPLDQSNTPTATVVGEDVDIYNAKNEPDGAGQVVGMLRVGTQVRPVGGCAPESWCQVTLPDGTSTGWVWGHLQLP